MSFKEVDFGIKRSKMMLKLSWSEEEEVLALIKSLKPGELIDKKLKKLYQKFRSKRKKKATPSKNRGIMYTVACGEA